MTPLAREQLLQLCDAKPERVGALRMAIEEGKIWGARSALDRECGCVMAHLFVDDDDPCDAGREAIGVDDDYFMAEIESLILNVTPGMLPANSPILAEVLAVVDEWIAARGAA